jgi:hypothetical protein
MVLEKNIEIWKCPYCGEEYDDELDAEECAKECVDVESPTEDERTEYYCEMCGRQHRNYDYAETCEELHRKKEDRHFIKWQHDEEMKKLAKAAAHPGQKKLVV